jgi:molybdopterin-guanine dinucleotide biosynthesis protein A
MKISHLFISPGHNFFGHHEQPPGVHPLIQRDSIQCVAGRGIQGDRFFDFKDNYKGQITFFSLDVFEDVCRRLGVHSKSPGVTRRNVVTTGVDLNTLIGEEFEVQGVRFAGIAECSPCYWMDFAVASGAERLMQGRGGLRARILTDGILAAERMNHSAVILAGGRSSRMGRDKASIKIGEKTLLERQIEIARETGAAEVLISGRPGVDYSDFDNQIVHDNFPDGGPLAGIEQALARAHSPRVLVLAVDLPEITASFLRTLVNSSQEKNGAIPRVNGNIEPLAAFYPKGAHPLAAELLRLKENSVINFATRCVQNNIATFCDLPASEAKYFTNWNSPSDFLSVS